VTSVAWKAAELRWCRLFGAGRRPSVGTAGWARGSDDDGSGPFAIEVKRSKRRVPEGRWIEQARANAGGRPWLLVVAGHNDRRPIAVVDAYWLAGVCRQAGLLPDERDP
jgi:hypothetical protein